MVPQKKQDVTVSTPKARGKAYRRVKNVASQAQTQQTRREKRATYNGVGGPQQKKTLGSKCNGRYFFHLEIRDGGGRNRNQLKQDEPDKGKEGSGPNARRYSYQHRSERIGKEKTAGQPSEAQTRKRTEKRTPTFCEKMKNFFSCGNQSKEAVSTRIVDPDQIKYKTWSETVTDHQRTMTLTRLASWAPRAG